MISSSKESSPVHARQLRGLITSAAIVALTCFIAYPVAAAIDPTGKLVEDSRELIRKGDLKSALIQLKRAVKEAPDNADARYNLGTVEMALGDYVAAERDLTVARDRGFPLEQINPKLAWLKLFQGKFDEVVKSVAPCPDDARCRASVLAAHARAYLQLRQPDAAEKAVNEALQADPKDDSARIAQSFMLATRGDNAAAEKVVDAVLEDNPKQLDALVLKGDLRRLSGDYKASETSYRAAITVNPNNLLARTHLVMAIMAQNRLDEAQAEIGKVLAQAPKSGLAIYLKALLLTRTNKLSQALELVRPVEKQLAEDPRGNFLLAVIHAGNNNLEEALKFAGTYHAAVPDNLVGTKLLAQINYRLRAFDKVVSLLAPLHDRLSNDGDALSLLGSAYLAEGRIKEANDMLAEAVKLRPDDTTARGRLALSHTRQSETREEGVHELEDLVNRDPQGGQADMALIATHMGAGDYDRAISAANNMIKHQPASPLPLTLRGSAKLAKGDEKGASEDFSQALKKDPGFVPAALYQAEIFMRNDGFDQARKVVGAILEKSPADLRALLGRAEIERRAGNPSAAIPYLEQAVNAHPEEVEPRVQMVQILTSLRDERRATAAANDLARTMSRNPSAVDVAAQALLAFNRTDEAVSIYRQLQSFFPQSPEVHIRLGQLFMGLGRLTDAQVAFDRAIAADGTNLGAWADRIAVERRASGFDSAMAIAVKGQKANPKNPNALLLVPDLLSEAGRYGEADEAYRQLLAQNSSPEVFIRLFHNIVKSGDLPKARLLMADWLAKHPDDVPARFVLADAELQARNYKAATEQYVILAQKMPRNVVVANNLAWAYDRLKDPKALDEAKRAYSLAPGNPQIVDTYGYMLYLRGDAKGAQLLREAQKADPRDPQILFHLARVLSDEKDIEGARRLLKPVIDSKVVFDEREEAAKLYQQLGGS